MSDKKYSKDDIKILSTYGELNYLGIVNPIKEDDGALIEYSLMYPRSIKPATITGEKDGKIIEIHKLTLNKIYIMGIEKKDQVADTIILSRALVTGLFTPDDSVLSEYIKHLTQDGLIDLIK